MNKSKRKVVVADIDGCCVDCSARLHHILLDNFDAYHAAHPTDRRIPQGCVIYKMFQDNPNFDLVFITSRDESAREYTLDQLHRWVSRDIKDSQLLMRPLKEYSSITPDTIMKPRLLREAGHTLEDVFIVFEDLQSMVDHWRSLGLTVYQTEERL